MKKEDLKSLMESVLEDSKTLLLKNGRLAPLAFMKCNEEIGVIPLSFRDDHEKNRQISILKVLVKKMNADAMFVVTESWYVTSYGGCIETEPSKHPMRKECIMMTGECEDGRISIVQLFGHEDDSIVFGEKMDMGMPDSSKFNFGIMKKVHDEKLRNLN
jgi:hypothetical protein